MSESMNGQRIYVDRLDKPTTIFVPIPRSLARDIDGGCQCDYCKAHPEIAPKWDCLAIPAGMDGNQHAWTVHMPEPGKRAVHRDIAGHHANIKRIRREARREQR